MEQEVIEERSTDESNILCVEKYKALNYISEP